MQGLKIALIAALTCVPVAGSADILSTKNKGSLFRSQTKVLDTRAKQQYKASVRLKPARVVTPSKWGTGKPYKGKYRGPYLQMAKDAAARHGIPQDLFLKLVNQESRWNAKARSHKGAIGLAQLMPFTAKKLGVDPHDPYENLEGGARYLKQQYRKFGNWRLALAAYNAGPGAVQKYGGIPPYRETQNYVRIIHGS